MTAIGLKNIYPNFRFGNDGKGGKEYVFTINDVCETKDDIDSNKYTNVTLELTCEIEDLLSDENFINWLDKMWENEILLEENNEKVFV